MIGRDRLYVISCLGSWMAVQEVVLTRFGYLFAEVLYVPIKFK